jgi:hypothetical protein
VWPGFSLCWSLTDILELIEHPSGSHPKLGHQKQVAAVYTEPSVPAESPGSWRCWSGHIFLDQPVLLNTVGDGGIAMAPQRPRVLIEIQSIVTILTEQVHGTQGASPSGLAEPMEQPVLVHLAASPPPRRPGLKCTLDTGLCRVPACTVLLVEVVAECLGAGEVAQLGHRFGLDLPDPFPGDPVGLADLVQGTWLAVGEAES